MAFAIPANFAERYRDAVLSSGLSSPRMQAVRDTVQAAVKATEKSRNRDRKARRKGRAR
jgi:hypothetical protein